MCRWHQPHFQHLPPQLIPLYSVTTQLISTEVLQAVGLESCAQLSFSSHVSNPKPIGCQQQHQHTSCTTAPRLLTYLRIWPADIPREARAFPGKNGLNAACVPLQAQPAEGCSPAATAHRPPPSCRCYSHIVAPIEVPVGRKLPMHCLNSCRYGLVFAPSELAIQSSPCLDP